jgi:SET and MYND domain-containing protein 4
MFCSDDCRNEAMTRYHTFECPIINQLLSSSVTHLTLRQFFVALSLFNGSIEKLKQFIEENEGKNFTIFDFDFNGPDCEKNRLIASRSLIRTRKTFPMTKHEEILKSHPTLSVSLQNHFDFVKSFMMWQRQISDLNFLGVFSGSTRKIHSSDKLEILNSLQQPIGIGSLLFGSFVNHSCANNVFR